MKYIVIILSILLINVPFITAQNIIFEEYPNNPVFVNDDSFDPTMRAYYPTVAFDINRFNGHGDSAYYKMWYSGRDGGILRTFVTNSEDGVNWTNVTPVTGLTNSHHCQVLYFPNGFIGINSGLNPSSTIMYYRIWYWDYSNLYSINAIRYAESPDGIDWYNDQTIQQVGSTVIDNADSSNWNRGSYGPVSMYYNPNGSSIIDDTNIWNNKFVMYYDGTTGGLQEIGLAYSTNGILWEGYGRVFERGGVGAWDSTHVSHGTVVKIDDVWHLWYSGGQGRVNQGIGHATSRDGVNWQRNPENPIFHKSDEVLWRSLRTYTPSVIYSPSGFETGGCPNIKMWITGEDENNNRTIGYAYGCISQTERNRISTRILYNLRLVEVYNPEPGIHYIKNGSIMQETLLINNIDNILRIGVQNVGILRANDVVLKVEDYESCMEIKINPNKADIPPKSIYYYEVIINPKCEGGSYSLNFKVDGRFTSQFIEFEFQIE